MSVYLVYNGKRTIEYCVPGCKVTHCHEKATRDCERCGTPTCNGHVSTAVSGHVCQGCRLEEWATAQGSRRASE